MSGARDEDLSRSSCRADRVEVGRQTNNWRYKQEHYQTDTGYYDDCVIGCTLRQRSTHNLAFGTGATAIGRGESGRARL